VGVAVVCLGHSVNGEPGISDYCRARVRKAEEITLVVKPEVVVFSGWARNGASKSEADLMAEEWGVEDAFIVKDPLARTTAENALFTRGLVEGHGGIDELVIVTSSWHTPRSWLSFVLVFRGSGIRLRMAPTKERSPMRLLFDEFRRLRHIGEAVEARRRYRESIGMKTMA
jgi:hypothetical protein